jgi:hypothetical protein
MIQLSKDQIKSIAGDLEMGMKCYCNLETSEIITLPDFDNNHVDEELWEKDITKLNKDFHRYVTIEGMSSHKAFKVMMEFVDTIADHKLRERLIYMMDKPHPFRNFKNEIQDSFNYREKWNKFREEKTIEWVESQINEYNLAHKPENK